MDFDNMTGPQLVAAYNEMVLTATDLNLDAKTVKRFPDQTTGRRRCAQLHKLIQDHKPDAAAQPEDKKEDDIPDFLKRAPQSDEEVEAIIAKQAKRGKKPGKELKVIEPYVVPEKIRKAIKRDLSKSYDDEPLLEDRGGRMVPSFSKQEVREMAKQKKSKSNGRFADDAKITKLSKENNARKGTHSYNLFEKIKTGMTIADWKKLAKERAGNYLRWYVSHGLVKVS